MNQVELTQSAQRSLDRAFREMVQGLKPSDIQRMLPNTSDGEAALIIDKIVNFGSARITGERSIIHTEGNPLS